MATIAKGLLGYPPLALRAAGWLARRVWRARLDLVRARGRVHKLSFFIHDFMDACRLEPDRIEACVFAAATADGPISMCLHNAKRDAFILQPVRLAGEPKSRFWNPLTGTETDQPVQPALPGRPNHEPTEGGTNHAPADLAAFSSGDDFGMSLLARAMIPLLAGLFSLMSIVTSAPAQDATGMSVREWESLWTRILADHVDDQGHIDFAALQRSHADLDRVVAFIATVDPVTRPELFPNRESRLAYSINAYNALAMYGVIDAGVPNSLGGLTKFTFFYLRTFTIGGRSVSLYSFENGVIRPLGEERIHFALNCMVVSCPRLLRTVLTADQLDHQLEKAAHEFVNETRNVRVDAAERTVWLSAIFQFYTKDFLAHASSLIEYVNRDRIEPIPQDFKVRFLDYDWTVNQRPLTSFRRSGLAAAAEIQPGK